MVRDKEAWRAAVHESWQLSNNKEDCISCLLLSKGILFSVFLWKRGAILHWIEHVLFCILVIRIILCINKTYLIKRASLIAQLVKNPPAVQETWFHSWVEKIRWRKRIGYPLQYYWASIVAQLVKNPPAIWETWVQSLVQEDHLEKGKATHSSILAWRIPWTTVYGSQRVGHDWATFTFTLLLK